MSLSRWATPVIALFLTSSVAFAEKKDPHFLPNSSRKMRKPSSNDKPQIANAKVLRMPKRFRFVSFKAGVQEYQFLEGGYTLTFYETIVQIYQGEAYSMGGTDLGTPVQPMAFILESKDGQFSVILVTNQAHIWDIGIDTRAVGSITSGLTIQGETSTFTLQYFNSLEDAKKFADESEKAGLKEVPFDRDALEKKTPKGESILAGSISHPDAAEVKKWADRLCQLLQFSESVRSETTTYSKSVVFDVFKIGTVSRDLQPSEVFTSLICH